MLGMVARLVDQKGVSLLTHSAAELVASDAQLVVLGEGDPHYHWQLRELQARFPAQIGVRLAYDESLAHRIEAGADMFLMPSRYEPSGLNQLYSLRVWDRADRAGRWRTRGHDYRLHTGNGRGRARRRVFNSDRSHRRHFRAPCSERFTVGGTSLLSGDNSCKPACAKTGRGTAVRPTTNGSMNG